MASQDTAPTTSTPLRRARLAQQAGLLLVALLLLAWLDRPDGRLRVIAPALSGDALIVQTPAGGFVLIDGGADPASLTTALGQQLPFWRRSLDMVVLTRADTARLPGQVAALERYHIGAALLAPGQHRGATFDAWRRLLRAEGTPVRVARAGERIELGGAQLRVLAAGDGEEAGLLLRLDYGATSVVLAHASGPDDEQALERAGALRPASLVIYPWDRDTNTPVLRALRPRALLLTDGTTAERPVQQTLDQRMVGGAAVYHERLHGAVVWASDGRQTWITTERQP